MIFPCPQCGQKLQAADDAAGKRCRCTKCKSLVAIPATALTARPVQQAPVPARPVGPPRNVLAEELDDLIVERRRQARQRAIEQREQQQQAEQQRRRRAKATAAQRGPKPAGVPVLVTVLLASVGVMCLFCAGGLGLLYWKNLPPVVVLQVDGYQATAYGRESDAKNDGQTNAKAVLSPITGSEFWIATTRLPAESGISVEELKSRFADSAASVEVVQRGGLQGVKCKQIDAVEMGLLHSLQSEMEIFSIPNQLVFLVYIPGSHKHEAGLQSRSIPVARERRHDNPERFFESLKPVDASMGVR